MNITEYKRMISATALGLILAFAVFGQAKTDADIRSLSVGQIVERDLKGSEAHSYKIAPAAGQYLQVVVEQKGIDAVVKLFGANRKLLREMNSPNDTVGFEAVSWVIKEAGEYEVEISSLKKDAKAGKYNIRWTARAATAADEERLEIELQAKAMFDEAQTLGEKGTKESMEASLPKFKEAIKLYQTVGDKRYEAYCLELLGSIYWDLGEYQKALDNLNQALPLFRVTQDKRGEGATFNVMGMTYWRLREYPQAIDYYNRALAIHRAAGYKLGEIEALGNLGTVYLDQNEKEKVLDIYQQVLAFYQASGDKASEARLISGIGTIYSGLGENFNKEDNKKALEYLSRALPLLREYGLKRAEGVTLFHLGKANFQLGEKQKAIDYYNQSLPVRRLADNIGEVYTLSALQNAWSSFGNAPLAIFYGKQAINKFQQLRQSVQGLNKETQKNFVKRFEDAYRRLADLLISEGRFAQAEQVLRMLKEEEYFDFVRRDADEIKNLSKRVTLNEKEKTLIEKYASLADRLALIEREYQKLAEKKGLLSRADKTLSAEEQKQFEELSNQVSTANAAFKLFLDKELVAELGREKTKEIEEDRSLQDKLKKWGTGTVALYTVMGEDRYRVILTTPTLQRDGKTEIKSAELNKKIFAFRDALQNPNIDPRPLGRELYDVLIKPIEKELVAAGAKTLVWSLDGTLRYIPLAALSPDGKTYLVEKYQNVIITPKTRDDVSVSNADWRALGLGVSTSQTVSNPDNPTDKINFSQLPGAEKELISIVKDEQSANEKGILSGKRFLDATFTTKALTDSLAKETMDGKRKYTVVHFASHFHLGSNWSNSFLLLGNGKILTLEEISNSPEINFGEVELVTLSACNTAFADEGNGKEVDSLAEAIQTRSGKSVLATLWSVVDESTQLLMSEFYRLRKENPQMSKAEAIQNAQTAMIEGKLKSSGKPARSRSEVVNLGGKQQIEYKYNTNAPFAHPYFWSPFVLIGNWR